MLRSENLKVRNIRAAVLRQQDGPVKIETLRMEGPRDDEALVRIVASGVCHTDISMAHHWEPADGPVVLGHEGAGVVEEVGGKIKSVRPGDHVILSYQSCGVCRSCRGRRPSGCSRFYELNFGFQRPDGTNALAPDGVRGHFFGQSSFASHVLATDRNMVRVSKRLSLQEAAPLGCGIQAGAGTIVNQLAVRHKESVVIFGAGAVGLSAVMAARIVKADPIIAVDILSKRLKLAKELGATAVVNARRSDVLTSVGRLVPEGMDYALETTGHPVMMRAAAHVTSRRGTTAYFTGDGIPDFVPKGKKAVAVIAGDSVPQDFIPRMIQWHRSGKFPFDRLIRFYDFKDIQRAIKDSLTGKTIKPVLCMP